MTERAIELLCLPEDTSCFILDLGCGSGLSGQVLEEEGHCWVGVDISEAMLDVAVERKQDEDITSCDLIQGDLGQGLPFRSGSFDGAISISALQWLCNADKSSHRPVQRLLSLFTSLYSCLARGSRAVLQFYPENANQIELVTNQAMKAGFTGGVVVDYPNSAKAKKMFLVLFTGGNNTSLPKGLEHESSNTVKYTEERRERTREIRGKAPKKSRDWILEKKARKRRQGREVRPDTKYTGRKRTGRFF
jgi:18S rRNA (guanine1575-N7)-methyltransferase